MHDVALVCPADTEAAPGPLPERVPEPAVAAALALLAEVARAAPRVWAWWPAGDGPLRVSGRPPADGQATDTADTVIAVLRQMQPEAITPEFRDALRRAQRPDGGLASPALLRALQRVQPLH